MRGYNWDVVTLKLSEDTEQAEIINLIDNLLDNNLFKKYQYHKNIKDFLETARADYLDALVEDIMEVTHDRLGNGCQTGGFQRGFDPPDSPPEHEYDGYYEELSDKLYDYWKVKSRVA